MDNLEKFFTDAEKEIKILIENKKLNEAVLKVKDVNSKLIGTGLRIHLNAVYSDIDKFTRDEVFYRNLSFSDRECLAEVVKKLIIDDKLEEAIIQLKCFNEGRYIYG